MQWCLEMGLWEVVKVTNPVMRVDLDDGISDLIRKDIRELATSFFLTTYIKERPCEDTAFLCPCVDF